MRQLVLAWFLLVWASFSIFAADKALVWEVTSGVTTVYLAGSIHELRPQDYPLHPLFEELVDLSDRVLFEANLDDLKTTPVILLGIQKGTYPQPDNLAAHLSPETYARVVQYAQNNGIRLYEYYRPWFLNQLFMTTELRKAEFNSNFGVDRSLFDRAKGLGKEISFLETAAFQIETLAALPETNMILSVETFLDAPSAVIQETLEILDAWRSGDAETLKNIVDQQREGEPELFHPIVTARNLQWLPTIEQLLQQTNVTTIIVGAAHLVGPQGLVELLRANGYTTTQLPQPVPSLQRIQWQTNGLAELTLRLRPAERYVLERSSDLAAWVTALPFAATNASQTVTYSNAPNSRQGFFRLRHDP